MSDCPHCDGEHPAEPADPFAFLEEYEQRFKRLGFLGSADSAELLAWARCILRRFHDVVADHHNFGIELLHLRSQLTERAMPVTDPAQISDGYHTMAELYDYRAAYNALAFNEWFAAGLYDIHKSWRHHDGELCFGGGGWFVVVAELPTGQISNHYPAHQWDWFHIPARPTAAEHDGHTPTEALRRMTALLEPYSDNEHRDALIAEVTEPDPDYGRDLDFDEPPF